MALNLAELSRDQLEAMVAKMAADAQRKLHLKVSDKGAVSLYGLGRFPVTLYKSQWERLIEAVKSGQVERFMEANDSLLSVKE